MSICFTIWLSITGSPDLDGYNRIGHPKALPVTLQDPQGLETLIRSHSVTGMFSSKCQGGVGVEVLAFDGCFEILPLMKAEHFALMKANYFPFMKAKHCLR